MGGILFNMMIGVKPEKEVGIRDVPKYHNNKTKVDLIKTITAIIFRRNNRHYMFIVLYVLRMKVSIRLVYCIKHYTMFIGHTMYNEWRKYIHTVFWSYSTKMI